MTNMEETESVEYKEWRQRQQKLLQYLDDATRHPLVEQEKILEHILRKNAETEYLRKYELNGATDVQTFRERLPISDYSSYKPYIDRIYQEGTSPTLCTDPVVEILRSSGTSGGEFKLFSCTQEDIDLRLFTWALNRTVSNWGLAGLEKGKSLAFHSIRMTEVTPGGLPCLAAVTSMMKKVALKQTYDPTARMTSPWQVIEAIDSEEAMYCHLLLGLLQREEVLRIDAAFASTLQQAARLLENSWQDICGDIASGTLHPKVKEDRVREAVLPMLKQDPELATLVRNEFSHGKSSDGFLRRLWPNVNAINAICTGSMEAYLPMIANYSNSLPVRCIYLYQATEGVFGINMDPQSPPEKVCYTLIPFSAYYEFIPVADAREELDPKSFAVMDALSVKHGQEYEIVVTTVSGLYRYRMGDILKVVGFYNSTPSFKFMRRRNVVLSIANEKTEEDELHSGVRQGTKVLEQELGWRLLEYTSTADFETSPAHYVIFWELVPSSLSGRSISQAVLEQCCTVMEANLNTTYRYERHDNAVGAMELRLVQEGTFHSLANYAFSQGANEFQYKVPRAIDAKRTALLDMLNSKVSQKVFAPGKPPLPPTFKPASSTSAEVATP